MLPAGRIGREMKKAIAELGKIKSGNDGPLTNLDLVASQAMTSEKLEHCWSEFSETLHPQRAVDHLGQEQVVCYRATAMAESFFTDQVLVETPLKTEFYKHLPGILTGMSSRSVLSRASSSG